MLSVSWCNLIRQYWIFPFRRSFKHPKVIQNFTGTTEYIGKEEMSQNTNIWLDPLRFDAALYRDGRADYPIEFLSAIKFQIFKDNPPPKTTKVFNIGCGPGKACLGLSKLFSKVYASDPSEVQLSEAPNIDNVIYEAFRSEKIITNYEPHIADLIFFGLSFQFTGVRAGTNVTKHILKNNAPSLMCAAGYHFGYILDPRYVPEEAYDFFQRVETGKVHQVIPGINNSPLYSEDITPFYPNHTQKSLYGIRHYISLPEASDYLDLLTNKLILDRVATRRDEEFMHEEMNFRSKKKIYFHTIEKTNVYNLWKNVDAWKVAVDPEQQFNYEKYSNEFCDKLTSILQLKQTNQPIFQGRIYYAYLCSDTLELN